MEETESNNIISIYDLTNSINQSIELTLINVNVIYGQFVSFSVTSEGYVTIFPSLK